MMQQEMQKRGILSNAVLKNIAYITMFIDHFFAVVYDPLVQRLQMAGYEIGNVQQTYLSGRAVGRVSFILFAYLAVEGIRHTRSTKAYLMRLGVFALVSEIPFDLAFSGTCFNWGSQNVFFTLFLGVLVLTVKNGASAAAVLAGCLAAYAFRTDYRFMGVLLIFAFYHTREKRLSVQMLAAGCVMLFGTWGTNCLRYADSYSLTYLLRFSMREMYGLFAFIPIALYHGRKGRQLPKAVCYGFYPVHLLLLYFAAAMLLGGAY